MITLGQIVGVHGIKGWVKIKSFTRPESNLFDHSQWWLFSDNTADPIKKFDLLETRWQSKGWVARLAGCNDRNTAELLRGALIQLPKAQLPALSEQEYYWTDLIGLAVNDLEGHYLGSVDSLIETGANDVLVVIEPLTKKRCLIPYLPQQVIRKIDLSAGCMLVDWNNDY